MLSKARLSHLRKLHQKKFRTESGLFLVEGSKSVLELLNSGFATEAVYATREWRDAHPVGFDVQEVTSSELKSASALTLNEEVLAVARIRTGITVPVSRDANYILLDDIRDPGNMGTLLRIADWFGMSGVICSEGCVEMYNPKVVQSSMGSIFRMPFEYMDLKKVLNSEYRPEVYAAVMDGSDIYKVHESKGFMLMIGNESNGITGDLLPLCEHKVSIPSYNKNVERAESLNAAVAAGILCATLCSAQKKSR